MLRFDKATYSSLLFIFFYLKERLIVYEDNVDIFSAPLLTSYSSFSSVTLSLIVMISFYILCKRLFLKRKGLSDARVVSVTKIEYGFTIYSL